MLDQTDIKICGLTRSKDVTLVSELGADYFGFIVYAPSPRAISVSQALEVSAGLPQGKRVLVDVDPAPELLAEYVASEFGYFQLHVETSVDESRLKAWAEIAGASRLWLAPRLKPGEPFPEKFLPYADTFLVDTYSSGQIGGTGQTGDWEGFSHLKKQYPNKHWVLAGGLSPENVLAAVSATGAGHVDVNSGVESAPGVKDSELLRSLFQTLRG